MKIATLIIAAALGCVAIDARAATPSPQVDPHAVAALARMSAYLRSIPAFQISLWTQRDDVDDYGQVITLGGGAIYRVRRPDAFFIDLALPSVTAKYVYDGKTVTFYDARTSAYGTVQAPSTIRATLELAEQKYGASVPLDDLFTWSDGDALTKALTAAHFVGEAQIAGKTTYHYAFRQAGRDWQIWIAEGDKPLPLRVAIVASNDPAKPQFRADLTWDTAPKFAPNAFTFAPAADAHAVDIHPIH